MRAGVLHEKIGLLLGFVPRIVYGLLAGKTVQSVIFALGAATAVTLIAGYSDLRKGMILTWATFVLFGGGFVAVAIVGVTEIIPWMGVVVYAVLAAVTFGSMAVGLPFTLQYARAMVDRSLWEKPGFIRVNQIMTGVWGAAFAINLLLSYFVLTVPGFPGGMATLLTYGVLAAGIVFTLWYPGHVRRRYSSREGQETP